jgi:putative ABC transport system permease protein
MLNDLRYALRMLAKTPASTALAVTALALGIGVNSAIFSVINGLFFSPLPFREPDKLVMVWGTELGRNQREVRSSLPDFLDWLKGNTVFENMAAFAFRSYNLLGRDEPLRILGQGVSSDFFHVLGVAAALGRTFSPTDMKGALGEHGKEHVVVISDSLWKRVFGGDPNIVGQTVLLDSTLSDHERFVIIGVTPPDFRFFHRQVWCHRSGAATGVCQCG